MCSLPLTGDTLFQMAEVHRQIQVQLEDVVRPENLHTARARIKFYVFFLQDLSFFVFLKTCWCSGSKRFFFFVTS